MRRSAQNGQPQRCRVMTGACHRCSGPTGHFHQILEPRAQRHVVGREGVVQGRVPLLRHGGGERCQRGLRCGPVAGAVRAPRAVLHPVLRRGEPVVAERAPPPELARALRGQVLGADVAVGGRVPLGHEVRRDDGEVARRRRAVPGAERAAVAGAGPGFDGRAPLVVGALGALPPGGQVRAGDHVARLEIAVPGRVPLPGDRGRDLGERVGDRHRLARAEGAPGAVRAGGDGRDPHVIRPRGAPPPDLAIGVGRHVLGPEGAIGGRVPLGDQVRRDDGEVARRGHPLPGAERAPAPGRGPVVDGHAPLVVGPLGALPPHPLVRADDHVPRPEIPVPGRVPLPGDGGRALRQCVGDRHGLVGAERAPGAARRPVGDDRGPHVIRPRGAPPPELLVRSVGDALRREGAVLAGVELGDEVRILGEGRHDARIADPGWSTPAVDRDFACRGRRARRYHAGAARSGAGPQEVA